MQIPEFNLQHWKKRHKENGKGESRWQPQKFRGGNQMKGYTRCRLPSSYIPKKDNLPWPEADAQNP
jgi:hypothetical protein